MTIIGHAQPTPSAAQVARDKQRILELRAEGYSAAYCAGQVGIARRTLYDWMEADPEFEAAWRDANECHHDWYEDRLRDGAANGHDVAIIVGLKMAGRFVDRQAPAQVTISLYSVFQQILAPPAELTTPPGQAVIEHQAPELAQPEHQGPEQQPAPQLEDGSTRPAKGKPSARPASRRRPERQPLPR